MSDQLFFRCIVTFGVVLLVSAITLSRASPCFPHPPVSTVKSEYHRRSVVQVFEQPADHHWHSLSECLDDGMMFKTGKGRFGVTEVTGCFLG